jgi:Zn-finger nucleic acid-binding protein
MNCPHCGDVEMAELNDGELTIHACPGCSGAFLEGAQLNALLLHANLPGVDSLGGRASPEAECTCPSCNIELVRVEKRATSMFYEACEGCGFMFVPLDEPAPEALDAARARTVQYFREFTASKR